MKARTSALTVAIATLVAATIAVLPSSVPGTAAPARAAVGDCTPGSDWGTLRQDLTARVLELVNQHRAARGLTQLSVSTTLTNAAIWKSRHMAKYVYMAHADPAPPVARSVSDRLLACGYPVTSAGWGENIAYGYSTADAVVQGWLNSPGHRANIENASFRSIGLGAAASSAGRLYWTQEFGTSTGGSTPPPPPPPSYACSNGRDDDGDGKIDFGADPGCSSTTDNDEFNAPPPPPPPPTGTKSAVPSSLTLNSGSLQAGGVASLGADDNSFLRLASSGGSVLWWARLTGISNALTTLTVAYRGLNSPTCTQNLSIWNWGTGAWISLDSRSIGATEVETTAVPTGALPDYVSGTTGSGDVAVRVRCTGTSAFTSSADLLRISYTAP